MIDGIARGRPVSVCGADERVGRSGIWARTVRHPATTAWVEDVENTNTHQDVVLIAGDPADPKSCRIHLIDAWASASYHLDEDDDPGAFAITFADITVEK